MKDYKGLSTELKRKLTAIRVAIIGIEAVEMIKKTLMKVGFTDIVTESKTKELPYYDFGICTFTEKEEFKSGISHSNRIGATTICAFNFGIGACATVILPGKGLPYFLDDKVDNDSVKAMIEYTSGYSKFWHIPANDWVDDAMKWIETPEISSSIGELTMTAIITHLIVAIAAGNEVKKYPKFYLSTIANDHN